MPTRGWLAFVSFVSIALLAACSDDSFTSKKDAGPSVDAAGCIGGELRCSGAVQQGCKDGKWLDLEPCAVYCAPSLKRCATCDPAQGGICEGDDLYECTVEGAKGGKVKTCPAGTCASGRCQDPCSKAAEKRSYLGCEYWPTVTSNASLAGDFKFAVVVANPQVQAVDVAISTLANPSLEKLTLQPGAVETIELPWIGPLKAPVDAQGKFQSIVLPGGAYRLTSTMPVSAYQFNPLNYQLTGDCKAGYDPTPGDNKCNSFSNDASLLLPEHVQTTEYMVLSRPSMMVQAQGQWVKSPGFVAVVGTRPGTTKVAIKFTGPSLAGPNFKAYQAGETGYFSIPQWGVLQVLSHIPSSCSPAKTDLSGGYCDLASTDLTGSLITTDQPVAVFGGHNCTFIPFDKWACDHLEEQLFPLGVWGKRYLATHTVSSGKDPALYRVVSGADGNQLTFGNGVHAPVTLDSGKWIELTSAKDFEVSGTGRFALVQFMVGQSYSATAGSGAPGDPAMALAVPVEQYRRDYRFLAPQSFEQNYVNVIALPDAQVQLDDKPVTGFQPVPDSQYQVAKVKIPGGNHTIEGTTAFGIAVYGVGSYTSYMYPGGLDLRLLQ